MNTVSSFFEQFTQQLSTIYPLSESHNIAKIAFEDLVNIKNLHATRILANEEVNILNRALERLLNHEPIQYIAGFTFFYGLKFQVSPAVLIPRPETEELVYWILEDKNEFPYHAKVLDIGTGSGCIPNTLKYKQENWAVMGIDVSKEALDLAKLNAADLGLTIDWLELDILNSQNWKSIPKQHIIVSNPPYIPWKEQSLMSPNVLEYEPQLALFVENDNPLVFYDKIGDLALEKLHKNGALYYELNEHNTEEVKKMLEEKGFSEVTIREDINGKKRMIKARL